MMVVSDSTSFEPNCYIETDEGERIESTNEKLKILGFMFSKKPTVAEHVKETIGKARKRYWVLRHLKRFGFDEKELVRVYTTIIRPVIEYCSVVYHSMLTSEQASDLERTQCQALKCIFGYAGESYESLREKAEIETLESRRVQAVDKFTDKCLAGRYSGWFPINRSSRTTRQKNPYEEKYARCNRLRNSPLYYMRRRLNERSREQ
jgi:hypothetical protein